MFLNLGVTIEDRSFIYKLLDKRDSFPFSTVRIPRKESNISQIVFNSGIRGEFLIIARSTIYLRDFITKAKELAELKSY